MEGKLKRSRTLVGDGFGFLGGGLVLELLLLPGLLLGGEGAELKGVDAALLSHFVAQKSINHPVAGGLHLGVEGVRCDDEAKVRLLGDAALHGLVVRMKVGVVVDFQRQRVERRHNLGANDILQRGR